MLVLLFSAKNGVFDMRIRISKCVIDVIEGGAQLWQGLQNPGTTEKETGAYRSRT
jgi:hypothetical protein